MKIIILAGGSGTRLWPLSRDSYPKQFVNIQGKEGSLFQDTFLRSLLLADLEDIYVITNEKYKFLVMGEVEELGYSYNEQNILIEPEPKNTLPAIYAGVHEIAKKGGDLIVILPSDHIISDSYELVSLIKKSQNLTLECLVTFGITPDSPNTGYGYISLGDAKENGFLVNSFHEKPDINKATEYINKGYLWNSGIFLFDSKLFSDEIKTYAPDIYNAFETSATLEEAFNKIDKGISIDYGVMEKSKKVAVVPTEIGWNDLGSFDSFFDVFDKDQDNNIVNKESIIIESSNNLVQSYAGKLVVTVGIENLIIIDNKDALLVCKRDHSQKVKDVVGILKEIKDPRTDYHVQNYRPWGHYKILEEEKESFKIKKIQLNPGKRLSYQIHHHRSEHWIVVTGMAKITIDGKESFVRSGESVFMKSGQKHRLENTGKIPLVVIEVQLGDYLEDDDILRFDEGY